MPKIYVLTTNPFNLCLITCSVKAVDSNKPDRRLLITALTRLLNLPAASFRLVAQALTSLTRYKLETHCSHFVQVFISAVYTPIMFESYSVLCLLSAITTQTMQHRVLQCRDCRLTSLEDGVG